MKKGIYLLNGPELSAEGGQGISDDIQVKVEWPENEGV